MELEINDLSEVRDAHLIELRNEVMLEHGGIVTRMRFDTVEAMSLETFKRKVLQGLKPDGDSLLVVKDTAAGSYTFILGDQAIRYKITEAAECSLGDVVEQLRITQCNKDVIHNMPMPFVREHGVGGGNVITAVFPAEQRGYKYRGNVYNIWIPRHWFGIHVDMGGRVTDNKLCVCPSWNPEFSKTLLYNWPLGNVYPDGHVCTGTSEVEAVIDTRSMSTIDMLIQGHERVMNMNCNDDLLLNFRGAYVDAVMAYRDKLMTAGQIKPLNVTGSMSSLVKATLEAMSTREGMEGFPYKRMDIGPENFT